MANVPLINGSAVDWAQITVNFLGTPLTGITAVEWDSTQDKKNNHGAGVMPVSRGVGKKDFTGSITFLAEEWKNIIAAAPNNDPLDIARFDVTILFVDPSNGLLMKVVWKATDINSNKFSSKTGDTMIEIQVPFIMGDIVYTTA